VKAVKEWGGRVFYVERSAQECVSVERSHSSEQHLAWLKDNADRVIVNDGSLEQLQAIVSEAL